MERLRNKSGEDPSRVEVHSELRKGATTGCYRQGTGRYQSESSDRPVSISRERHHVSFESPQVSSCEDSEITHERFFREGCAYHRRPLWFY